MFVLLGNFIRAAQVAFSFPTFVQNQTFYSGSRFEQGNVTGRAERLAPSRLQIDTRTRGTQSHLLGTDRPNDWFLTC